MGIWNKLFESGAVASGVVKNVREEEGEKKSTNTQTLLNEAADKKTMADEALKKILERDPFKFDLNGEALYQQYKDSAMKQGRIAMEDAIGKASAMTGGYGNTWAQSVGQQAYGERLDALGDMVPEIYQLALDRYDREGDELLKNYQLLSAEEEKTYDRYRDFIGDEKWQAEFDATYGEKNAVEDVNATTEMPSWYKEGGTYSPSNPEEYNKVDLENLAAYLGVDDLTGMKDIVKAACEKFGTRDGNEAVDMAFQMMYRELNYGEVYLDPNILANVKALKTTSDIEAYVSNLESRGMINPATADYLRATYSVTSEGGTKRSEIEAKAKTFTNNDALAAWAYGLADQGIISEDEAYSLIEENYKEE